MTRLASLTNPNSTTSKTRKRKGQAALAMAASMALAGCGGGGGSGSSGARGSDDATGGGIPRMVFWYELQDGDITFDGDSGAVGGYSIAAIHVRIRRRRRSG